MLPVCIVRLESLKSNPFSSSVALKTPPVVNVISSLSAPGDDSALINVSWSTSITPPKLFHAFAWYPSKALRVLLNRICPVTGVGLCAVVPTGIWRVLSELIIVKPVPLGVNSILPFVSCEVIVFPSILILSTSNTPFRSTDPVIT